ncbi:MAG: hypothetical protein LBS60_04785 [Deltaproteobacteria bacterium]|jgi:hypothetical protein|nr:hypothetical protein [Deltaproteobacteria bacterium]
MDDFKTDVPESLALKSFDQTVGSPTPLADPVIMAIFQSVELSGLAMKSLVNAVLADSGGVHIKSINRYSPKIYSLRGKDERGGHLDLRGER